MSGIEKEELADRIRATTGEEQIIIARLLHDDVLWAELRRRYELQNYKTKEVKNIAREK